MVPISAVLVVNYFSHHAAVDLLRSVPEAERSNVVVSVVDNSEDEQELSALLSGLADLGQWRLLQVTQAAANLGYAAGNNLAFAAVSHVPFDVVTIANPDTVIIDGSLSAVASEAIASGCILTSTTIDDDLTYSGLSVLRASTGQSTRLVSSAHIPRHSYPGGHFLVVSRMNWQLLGGFDENFFLYCEEMDLALRAQRAGIAVGTSSAITVSHVGGLTTGGHGSDKSPLTYTHASRSRVLLYRKHRQLRRFVVPLLLTRFAWLSWLLLRQQREASFAIAKGLIDGVRAPVHTGRPR